MSYSYDKFLRPITTTDKNIQIIDNTGIVKYTINPFSIVNVMISNNLLKINMKQSRTILINFSSTNEAKLAISKLQEQIDILTEKTPLFIDKQIANYVDDRINSVLLGVGATGPQGPTGADGGIGATGSQGATGSTGAVSFGTSSTPLQIPAIGYVTSLNLQPNLAFTPMQTVIAYSNLTDNYMVDDYIEGDTGTYFIGQIESYDYISGDMSIIVDYSSGYGATDSNGQIATYSLWYVNLSGREGSADLFLTGGTLSNILNYQSDYSSGFITHSLIDKNYVDTLIADITVSDENTIYVRKQGGDFLTIKEAVDSITTASSSNAYVIKVGGGVYQEQQIQMKSYVSVVGESSVSTIIEAIDSDSTLIIGADQSIIADCQIQGCTGTGVAAVEYSSPTTPQRDAIFYVENVRFGENYTHARVVGTTSGPTAGNCIMQCSNVKYGGYPFTLGFHVTNNGTTAADGIGRMQLRNVTSTNGGITTTSGLVFAKADKPGCAFIVNGCLLTKSVGAAAGIGFHIENGGVLRATSVNLQRWAKGIYVPEVGTVATSIDALAVNFEGCTKDVVIEDPKTTGKVQGTDNYSKTNIILSAPFYEVNKDPRIITVAKKGGDFTSLSSAVNSINDSGEDNRYVIKVGPGRYTENEINLVGKPYVSIVGSDIQTTTIEPIYATNSVFVLGNTNELSFMTIQGAGAGYAGIECTDIGDSGIAGFSLVHKISMYDCDTMVLVKSTSANTPVQFYGEYLDINGTYTYGIKVEVESGSGGGSFANLENFYAIPYSSGAISSHVSGVGAELVIQGGSIQAIESAIGDSTGVYIEDLARLSLFSIDIMNQEKALHVGNVGGPSTFECSGVVIKDCNNDLYIEHSTTSGVFQGISSHGKITNSSPYVSWAFLDSSDGEYDITKKISVTFEDGTHTDLSSIIFDGSPMGIITGSTLSVVSGLTLSLSNGTGYIQGTSSQGIVKNLTYTGPTGSLYFSVPDNSSEYVYLYDEVVNIYSTSSLPNTQQNIVLGRVVTSNGEVVFIDRSPIVSKHQSNKNTDFIRQAIGPVYEYGSIVTYGVSPSNPFELNVSSGSYFYGNTNFKPSGSTPTPLVFKQFYTDGSGGWIITSTSSVNTQFDNSGTLTSLTSGFAKHSLYVVGDGTEEQYLLVLGQEEYLTQLDTELGSIPTPPDYFTEGVTLLASIYIKAGSSSIFQIEDMRNLGFKSSARSSEIDKVNDSIQLVKDNYLPLDGGVILGNLEIEGTFSSTGLTELSEVIEVINSGTTGATASTVTYDFSGGSIFYHGTASQNYTADFINIPTTNNRTTTVTIIIDQDSTPYIPTVVKIEGTTQSVKWSGGTYSGTANGVDIVGFTFIRTSSAWTQVLGQINPFS